MMTDISCRQSRTRSTKESIENRNVYFMFTGCDLLLEGLQNNSNLHVLNLSSCCLTNRSATCLSLYLKKRRMDLLQSAWNESTLSRDDNRTTVVCIEKGNIAP